MCVVCVLNDFFVNRACGMVFNDISVIFSRALHTRLGTHRVLFLTNLAWLFQLFQLVHKDLPKKYIHTLFSSFVRLHAIFEAARDVTRCERW